MNEFHLLTTLRPLHSVMSYNLSQRETQKIAKICTDVKHKVVVGSDLKSKNLMRDACFVARVSAHKIRVASYDRITEVDINRPEDMASQIIFRFKPEAARFYKDLIFTLEKGNMCSIYRDRELVWSSPMTLFRYHLYGVSSRVYFFAEKYTKLVFIDLNLLDSAEFRLNPFDEEVEAVSCQQKGDKIWYIKSNGKVYCQKNLHFRASLKEIKEEGSDIEFSCLTVMRPYIAVGAVERAHGKSTKNHILVHKKNGKFLKRIFYQSEDIKESISYELARLEIHMSQRAAFLLAIGKHCGLNMHLLNNPSIDLLCTFQIDTPFITQQVIWFKTSSRVLLDFVLVNKYGAINRVKIDY